MIIRTLRLVAFAAILLAAESSALAEALTPINRFPGGDYILPSGISGDGSAVAGYGTSSAYTTEAFRWTSEGGTQGLGVARGGVESYATSMSADGLAVAGYGGTQAIRWTSSDGMMALGSLTGGCCARANGISADGSVVVGYGGSSAHPNGEAFRWTLTDGMVGLGSLPGGNLSFATAVSGDGSTVVGRAYSPNSGEQAFRWTEGGGMAGLGFLPDGGFRSQAAAVSADGSVVVGWGAARSGAPNSSTHSEAFRWTAAGGMAGLGVLPGKTSSEAVGVSGDGSVVVGRSSSGGDDVFIWTPEAGMQSLLDVLVAGGATELTGWRLYNVFGISADGRHVLVAARDQQGQFGPYIAHLVPVPPTLFLFASALASLAARRRPSRIPTSSPAVTHGKLRLETNP